MSEEQLLLRGLAALDIDLSGTSPRKLHAYIEEIQRWNPLYGLVNAEGEELIIKHVLDSLAPWRAIETVLEQIDVEVPEVEGNAMVTDIGTGAGFPGIPLSIVLPHRRFRLVERLERRIRFLETTAALLSLHNVAIHAGSVEFETEPFQCVVFRALKPFSDRKLFRFVWKNLVPGGAIIAYKGKAMSAKIELQDILDDPHLGSFARNARIEPVWVPFLDEERCLVISRKA